MDSTEYVTLVSLQERTDSNPREDVNGVDWRWDVVWLV